MPLNKDPNSTLVRVCVRLFRSDHDYLKRVAEMNGGFDYNGIIRNAVHAITNQFRDKERQKIDAIKQPPEDEAAQ